jgi:hypothetical protein
MTHHGTGAWRRVSVEIEAGIEARIEAGIEATPRTGKTHSGRCPDRYDA